MNRCDTTTPRPRPADDAPRSMPANSGDLARVVEDRLNAIRGYCELAMIKGENGDALARRMTTAIAAIDELSLLILKLIAHRSAQPALEADGGPRLGAKTSL